MYKKLINTFLLSCIVMSIAAQQSSVITIYAKDSVILQPTDLKYVINFSEEIDLFEFDNFFDEEDQDEEEKTVPDLDKIKNKLSDSGFEYVLTDNELLENVESIELPKIEIPLSNSEEFEKLKKALSELDYEPSGELISETFEEEAPKIKMLFEKLKNKAYTDAENMAAINGKKVGKVLSIKEQKKGEFLELMELAMNSSSFYTAIFKELNAKEIPVKVIMRSFEFVFELKD